MRLLHVVVGRVRIGARDDDHAELAAAGDQFAEGIASPSHCAAMMQRTLVGNSATHRPRSGNGVGLRALEVIEPELRIELCQDRFRRV
jgi:hypothetical protein